MKIGYARVSRDGQTTEQQVTALLKEGCEQEAIFEETGSGADRKRPKLKEALAYCRKGDVLVIWKLDRLARSLAHLWEIANDLKARGVELISITDSINTTTASGKLLFSVLGAIAEFERDCTVERVNAGLERARGEGRKGGRQKTEQGKLDIAFANLGRGLSQSKAAKEAGISRSTLTRALIASKTCHDTKRDNTAIDATKDARKRRLNGSAAHHLTVAS